MHRWDDDAPVRVGDPSAPPAAGPAVGLRGFVVVALAAAVALAVVAVLIPESAPRGPGGRIAAIVGAAAALVVAGALVGRLVAESRLVAAVTRRDPTAVAILGRLPQQSSDEVWARWPSGRTPMWHPQRVLLIADDTGIHLHSRGRRAESLTLPWSDIDTIRPADITQRWFERASFRQQQVSLPGIAILLTDPGHLVAVLVPADSGARHPHARLAAALRDRRPS